MPHLMASSNPACWTGETLRQVKCLTRELAPCHVFPSVRLQDCVACLNRFKVLPWAAQRKRRREEKKGHLLSISMASRRLIGNSLPYSVSLFDLVLGSLKQGADWETVSRGEGNILFPRCAIDAAPVPLSWASKEDKNNPSLPRPAPRLPCASDVSVRLARTPFLYLQSCVLSGLLEGFLQDRRAWLQSGVGANHLDDFFRVHHHLSRSAKCAPRPCHSTWRASDWATPSPASSVSLGVPERTMNAAAMIKTNTVISLSNRIAIQWSSNECSEIVVSWNILWTRLEVLKHLFVKSVIAGINCDVSTVYLILFIYSPGQRCFRNEREIFVLLP